MGDQDVGWFYIPVALDSTRSGVFHAQAELNGPLHCLFRVKGCVRPFEMVSQAHSSLSVGSDVFHRDKQPTSHLFHPCRSEDVRVPFQVHPQEGLILKCLPRGGVSQQFVAEGLQCAHGVCIAGVNEINNAEPAFPQCAKNLILAADHIARFVESWPFSLSHVQMQRLGALLILWRLLPPAKEVFKEAFHGFRTLSVRSRRGFPSTGGCCRD